MPATFWDEKFSGDEYLYGTTPNQFFKQSIDSLKPGTLLIPGDGEGRNAIYAAKSGWQVHAFDTSKKGREKALQLASDNNVKIEYEICDYQSFESNIKYDAIVLVFSHLPSSERQEVHRKYVEMLNPGGTVILQTFSKEQLRLNSGGPKNIDLLFSVEELKEDFKALSTISAENKIVELNEGPLHRGKAHVIELIGIK